LKQASAHLAPIVLRAQGDISQPHSREVSWSMEDRQHSDKQLWNYCSQCSLLSSPLLAHWAGYPLGGGWGEG
jgi:hypothetical protein